MSRLVRKTDVKKNFGTSVRVRRKQLGISQEELAERAELHRTYVSDVERGARNVSLESIEKLARALNVSVAALFPQSEPQGSFQVAVDGNGAGKDFVDVLLVEDNSNDVELTLHAFNNARFANRVHVVRDGAEALDYIFHRGEYALRRAEDRPQLILLDLNLPKVSGLEVLRKIKEDRDTRTIPVAILTTSQKDRDIAECLQLGAQVYITKPVDFVRLSEATPQLNLDWALIKSSETKSQDLGA
jgi:CheY-like chemotaxis protein/DNA-binding transcriptional regulator YiaG